MAVWSKTNIIEVSASKRIDSEFFHPKYVDAEKTVNRVNNKALGALGNFLIGPFGSAFHVNNYDPDSPFRYIRGKDVKPFNLLDDDNVYMPEKDFFRLKRYAIQPNDILITVVGTLGNVAIVPENEKGIFSCKSTIFRNSTIDPYYLISYLNSNYGRECLLRRQRGAIQTGLNKEDLKTVPIPIFDEATHKAIGDKIRKSIALRAESKSLYSQATQLLEQELGLDKIQFKKQKSYTANFSEVVISSRQDADFFQPKYIQLINHLSNFELQQIKFISEKLETGIYSSSYDNFGLNYIRGTDIEADGTIQEEKLFKSSVVKPTYQNTVLQDDILVTRVGSIGVCAIVLSDERMLFSDNLIRIRIINSLKEKISAKYLILFLQSKYGQMLMTRYSRGSVQQRLNQSQLGEIPFPNIRYSAQLEIEELYIKSVLAKKESNHLLEQAKTEVENLIEQAANN